MASNNTNSNDINMVEMAATAQKVSASIPQGAKDIMQSAKEKVFDNDKLRSFSVFFGTGEQNGISSAYSLVLMPTTLCQRLWKNTTFFYLNYILLTAIVFTICLLGFLLNPKSIIILTILASAWFGVLRLTREEGVKVLCLTVTRKEASALMMVVSIVVGVFAFQEVFYYSIGCSAFLAFVHAMLRDASIHQVAAEGEGDDRVNALEPEAQFS